MWVNIPWTLQQLRICGYEALTVRGYSYRHSTVKAIKADAQVGGHIIASIGKPEQCRQILDNDEKMLRTHKFLILKALHPISETILWG
jgi:hypothetical protein